jgi:hypothetical protein
MHLLDVIHQTYHSPHIGTTPMDSFWGGWERWLVFWAAVSPGNNQLRKWHQGSVWDLNTSQSGFLVLGLVTLLSCLFFLLMGPFGYLFPDFSVLSLLTAAPVTCNRGNPPAPRACCPHLGIQMALSQ